MVFYIYKIKNCNYIGSTTDLIKREKKHNSNLNCCKYSSTYNFKLYKYVRKNNIKIKLILIATYKHKCSFKIQRLVEQYWINKYHSVKNGLNSMNSFGNKKKTIELYRQKGKKKIKCSLCGCFIQKVSLRRHQKTKKCRKNSI